MRTCLALTRHGWYFYNWRQGFLVRSKGEFLAAVGGAGIPLLGKQGLTPIRCHRRAAYPAHD
jgi:hypothetical protein